MSFDLVHLLDCTVRFLRQTFRFRENRSFVYFAESIILPIVFDWWWILRDIILYVFLKTLNMTLYVYNIIVQNYILRFTNYNVWV